MSILGRLALGATALVGLGFALPASAQTASAQSEPTYTRITTIPVPPTSTNTAGTLTSFDISWVDQKSETYFLADRSNKSVDIFDAHNATFITSVTGTGPNAFVGAVLGPTGAVNNDASGPNGVVSVGENELWVGDGDSSMKIINLNSFTITDKISTGGTARADEVAYDPVDKELIVINDADTPPFATFISTGPGHPILAKVPFPDATNGVEQPVYDRTTGLFYVAVPQVGSNVLDGAIRVFDPKTFKALEDFPVSACQPHGLALGARQQFIVGCNLNGTNGFSPNTQIIQARDGSLVTVVRQVGGSDEVWFNPGNKTYFLGASSMTTGIGSSAVTTPVLGIIDARTNTFVESIPTTTNAHSVAADRHNNFAFVPLTPTSDPACSKGCIGVYAPSGGSGGGNSSDVASNMP
jgi:hypothetical protein